MKFFCQKIYYINLKKELNIPKEDIANEGLRAMENWMKELGIVLDSKQLGVTSQNIEQIMKATRIYNSGYKSLNREEIEAILIASMH